MVTQLRVLNECLAIMGEAPLASLNEEHAYKSAVLNKLTAESQRIQSKGWWYNTESLTLVADAFDRRVRLPGDGAAVLVFSERPNVALRGAVLYDLENGTDQFPAGTRFAARLVRTLPIELVPTSAAEYIAAKVVLWFQNSYDGDQTKTRNLAAALVELEADMKSEHIRNRKVNLLDNNPRLARIRNTVRRLGR